MSDKKKRYTVLDVLRGIAVLAMIAYHTLWDLVCVHHVDLPWFYSDGMSVFRMSIRWAFILISGFSWSLGRKRLRRGITVFLAGILITAVTMIIMPRDVIIFGVLTFLGSAMLLTIPLDKLFKRLCPYAGLVVSAIAFLITLDIKDGYLGFFGLRICGLPSFLYANYFTSYLGFLSPGFSSSDYVPLIPWIFLFWFGYFLYRIFEKNQWLKCLSCFSFKPLEWVGRHALIIYVIHQPLISGILYLWFNVLMK